MLAVAIARYRTAEAEIARGGLLVKSPAGHQIQSPWVAISNRALFHARQLSADLGMSPTSATRATVRPAAAPLEFDADGNPCESLDHFLDNPPPLPNYAHLRESKSSRKRQH
jgi:phage terminase small subunit